MAVATTQGRPVFIFVGGRGRGEGIQVHDECPVFDVTGDRCDTFAMPNMPEGRAWAAVVSNRNTVYVVGGYPVPMKSSPSLFKFSLLTMTWTKLTDMWVPRIFHTACLVGDYIVVMGGINDCNGFERSTECYHIKEDAWYIGQEYLPSGSHDLGPTEAASCAWRGQCVVSGGWRLTVGCYNIQSDKWTHLADMVHGRRGHLMACVNDRLYVFGGTLTDNIEMYDPDVGQFTVIAEMGIRICHTTAVTYSSIIILPGGNDENAMLTFDTNTYEVTKKVIDMPPDISQGQVILLYITFPSLKDICNLKILNVLKNDCYHGNKWKTHDIIGRLNLPSTIEEVLLEQAQNI